MMSIPDNSSHFSINSTLFADKKPLTKLLKYASRVAEKYKDDDILKIIDQIKSDGNTLKGYKESNMVCIRNTL